MVNHRNINNSTIVNKNNNNNTVTLASIPRSVQIGTRLLKVLLASELGSLMARMAESGIYIYIFIYMCRKFI